MKKGLWVLIVLLVGGSVWFFSRPPQGDIDSFAESLFNQVEANETLTFDGIQVPSSLSEEMLARDDVSRVKEETEYTTFELNDHVYSFQQMDGTKQLAEITVSGGSEALTRQAFIDVLGAPTYEQDLVISRLYEFPYQTSLIVIEESKGLFGMGGGKIRAVRIVPQ